MVGNTKVSRLSNIPLGSKMGYGVGNFGNGIIAQIISSYLVFYATAVKSVPGSLVGLAVSISVIWNAIIDPLMGYISDKTSLKHFGRRHLYLLIGTIGTAIFNYVLWIIGGNLPTFLKFLWILIDLLIIKTFTTIYATPYSALGAELSCDYNERTAIQGIKTIFYMCGIMVGIVMGMLFFFAPTLEFPIGQLNPDTYAGIGFTSSIVMVLTGAICFIATKKYIPHLPKLTDGSTDVRVGMFKSFRMAFSNKQFSLVVLGYLFTNMATAVVSTLGLHVFTYTFALSNKGMALVLGSLFLSGILSQPVWVLISQKMDKKPSILLGLGISFTGCVMLFILVLTRDVIAGNMLYILFPAIFIGFGTGGLFSIPLSMIADTIDLEELKTGVRPEGIYFGCQTLSYKLSQSVAIFLLGVLLDVIKFNSNIPVQPESTLTLLGCIMTLGSAAALIAAFISYLKYDLDRNKVRSVQQQIAASRGGRSTASL